MIRRERIEYPNSTIFKNSWELYLAAFPKEERRSLEYHIETMRLEEFRFEAIYDDKEHVGVIGWWEFEDLLYIEHLATFEHLRGRGCGKRALEQFLQTSPREVVLEVEHPQKEIQHRRIEFYRRLGFHLNEHQYSHPSYWGEEQEVSLLIMSYPHPITAESIAKFKRECHPTIHFLQ